MLSMNETEQCTRCTHWERMVTKCVGIKEIERIVSCVHGTDILGNIIRCKSEEVPCIVKSRKSRAVDKSMNGIPAGRKFPSRPKSIFSDFKLLNI